jgi:hypothetical protein
MQDNIAQRTAELTQSAKAAIRKRPQRAELRPPARQFGEPNGVIETADPVSLRAWMSPPGRIDDRECVPGSVATRA